MSEQRGHAPRAPDVLDFQLFLSTQKKATSRGKVPHFSRSRISRHPLLFNDADEVSCRAGAIKCSRCRASFAPIRAIVVRENWVPVGPATRRSIKRNKELSELSKCFPRVLKSKLFCSFTLGRVDLDEGDAGFRQTRSKTPVPAYYGLSIYLRVVFWKGLQEPRVPSYRLW